MAGSLKNHSTSALQKSTLKLIKFGAHRVNLADLTIKIISDPTLSVLIIPVDTILTKTHPFDARHLDPFGSSNRISHEVTTSNNVGKVARIDSFSRTINMNIPTGYSFSISKPVLS